jgi:hypothetical protein
MLFLNMVCLTVALAFGENYELVKLELHLVKDMEEAWE